MPTEEIFREDAYLRSCTAHVRQFFDGVVELDRTVFYPMGGGQPGDRGTLERENGVTLEIADTRKGALPEQILHVLTEREVIPAADELVTLQLDWDRRYRLMRMHSCLHLLCKAVDGVVTGGQISDGKGRLDFDIPEPTLDKDAITEQLMNWIEADKAIRHRWITAAELDARPELVRTMSVRPPSGSGHVRLVEIDGIDLQACGGTHVRSTAEIGKVRVAKIEKKGRQNRRVSVVLDDA
ncbi:MAG: alanyl-tRNA editing protein [Pseudomonadota bacterium]